MRSGYAFAHQAGFGELITSGLNMKDRARDKDPSVVLTKFVRGLGQAWSSGTQAPWLSGKSSQKADNSDNRKDDSKKSGSRLAEVGDAASSKSDRSKSDIVLEHL